MIKANALISRLMATGEADKKEGKFDKGAQEALETEESSGVKVTSANIKQAVKLYGRMNLPGSCATLNTMIVRMLAVELSVGAANKKELAARLTLIKPALIAFVKAADKALVNSDFFKVSHE
jgi:hypothetical protein